MQEQKSQSLAQIAQQLKSKMQTKPASLEPAQAIQVPQPAPFIGQYDGPCSQGPACPICGGSGWYRVEVPPGHPLFGKLQACPNVSIWKAAGAEHYGLETEEVEEMNWGQVMALFDGRSLNAAERVQQILERGWGWLYLYGDHGQAKTLILKIAVATALRSNKMAAYANMADVIAHIQRAFDENDPNRESESRLEWWGELPILALDEFDRFNKTKWADTSQFRLMDKRNNLGIRQKGVTLIASNTPPEALDGYYRSRIQDGRFETIPLFGQDARPLMTHQERF